MAFTNPTWGGLDFGLDNDGDDTLRSFVRVVPGPTRIARGEFGFPGVDGIWAQRFGNRGQPIVWLMEVMFKNLSALNALEADLAAALSEGVTYQMTFHGQTRDTVELVDVRTSGPITPLVSPYAGLKRLVLVFEDHDV